MRNLFFKASTVVAILAIAYFCLLEVSSVSVPAAIVETAPQREINLMVTKPYPLNDWDVVENPGGYFLEIDLAEETTKTETYKPVYHNSAPTTEPVTEVSTTSVESTEEEKETVEDSDSAADPSVDETTEVEATTKAPTPQYIIKAQHYAVPAEEIYFTWPVREYTEEEKTLLAKMLYCEAGGEGWDCQVATLSGIINHIEHNNGNFGVLDKGNHFSPASYYRYKTPTKMNWEVLDYVLAGHLIADVKYFQLYAYHSFGTPMFKVGGVYFSR